MYGLATAQRVPLPNATAAADSMYHLHHPHYALHALHADLVINFLADPVFPPVE